MTPVMMGEGDPARRTALPAVMGVTVDRRGVRRRRSLRPVRGAGRCGGSQRNRAGQGRQKDAQAHDDGLFFRTRSKVYRN